MTKRAARHEVPREQTWDLESLYPTTTAWEADLGRVEALIPPIAALTGRLGEGAAVLLDCLRQQDALTELANRLLWFAYNSCTVDQGNPVVQGLRDRAMAMSARVQSALAFIEPEILALPQATVSAWLEAEPALAVYRLYLSDIVARAEHTLGAEAEAALAAMGELAEAPYVIWQNTTAADIQFESVTDEKGNAVPLSVAAASRLLQSPDR
ncbi:MAG: oligoendopeptidase, partial [Firmicutes bacterium]|nr:oligoendopeptidase [Bacillota bacterium]